jgi:hypothetical protein
LKNWSDRRDLEHDAQWDEDAEEQVEIFDGIDDVRQAGLDDPIEQELQRHRKCHVVAECPVGDEEQ